MNAPFFYHQIPFSNTMILFCQYMHMKKMFPGFIPGISALHAGILPAPQLSFVSDTLPCLIFSSSV